MANDNNSGKCHIHLHRELSLLAITIYHNPACGISRNVLAMIRATGEEPHLVEYLREPPSRTQFIDLIVGAGLTVRSAIRQEEPPYETLGLTNPSLTVGQLLDAMLEYPVLIDRPFVKTSLGVRLASPSEVVLEVLESSRLEYTKEEARSLNGRQLGGALRPTRLVDLTLLSRSNRESPS